MIVLFRLSLSLSLHQEGLGITATKLQIIVSSSQLFIFCLYPEVSRSLNDVVPLKVHSILVLTTSNVVLSGGM